MIPTLTNGFVLIALPAFVARAAAVVALGTAAGLIVLMFRLYDLQDEPEGDGHDPAAELEGQDEDAWELA